MLIDTCMKFRKDISSYNMNRVETRFCDTQVPREITQKV